MFRSRVGPLVAATGYSSPADRTGSVWRVPQELEPAQPQSVVLAVVTLLGLVALVGLCGGMWLIHESGSFSNVDAARNEAAQIAVVFTTVGGAVGALAGILASTRSAPPQPIAQAQAQGYQMASDDLVALATPAVTGDQPPNHV